MRDRNGIYSIAFCTALVVLVWAYSVFTDYFGRRGDDYFRAQTAQHQLQKETFARELAEARLRDFAQEVAAVLPDQKGLEDSFQKVASLKQVTRAPASFGLDLSGVKMEKAKGLFRDKKYAEAIKEFENIVDLYPTSPQTIEAMFLINESAFLIKDDRKVVKSTDFMVSHFPQDNYTGYALLRLGQTSERNAQLDEAHELYQTVGRSFKDPKLKSYAKELSGQLE